MNKNLSHILFALILGLIAAVGALVVLENGLPVVRAAPLDTDVSGNITSDTTWTRANSPYVLTDNVIVNSGVTLTIESGVVVQGQTDTELRVNGNLIAIGAVTRPITFTSQTDTGPGQWRGLVFDGGAGNLEHVTVRYGANDDNSLGNKSNIAIVGVTKTVRIANSAVLSGSYGGGLGDYGIYIKDSQVTITNTRIAGHGSDQNVDYGLYATGNCTLTVAGNTFSGNAGWGARVDAGNVQDVYNNTFYGNGYNRVRVGGGSVVTNSRMAAQSGLEGYYAEGTLSVPAGVTLTIEAGVKAMFPSGAELTVQGSLGAAGAATQPITLTSVNDSGPGQWKGLVFNGGAGNLEHVTVRYGASDRNSKLIRSNITIEGVTAGQVRIANSTVTRGSYGGSVSDYGIYVKDSRVTISGSKIISNGADLSYDYGLYATGNCTLTVAGNTFSGNAGWGARVDAGNVQDVYNNTFYGNGYNRVRVGGGNTSAGAKMVVQSGLEGYEVYGSDLIVPAGVTLTVESGVMVMAKDYELHVQGHLEAVGAATQPITFTSADNNGAGQWQGLVFDSSTGNLEHVVVRYGGRQNSQVQNSNITIRDASPNIAAVRIASSRVVSSSNDGIYIESGGMVISDTSVSANANDGLEIDNGFIAIDHTTIEHNGQRGVNVNGGIIGLQCSTVYSNTGDGIYVSGSPLLMPLSSAIYDNGGMGLNNTTASTVTAAYNWWGAADGPGPVGPGSGDEVSSNVEYTPWLPAAICLADLSIAKSDAPDPVDAQSPLTYTLVITNNGPGNASAVQMTDTLPSGVQFASVTTTLGTCNHTGGVVACDVGNMNPREIVTVAIHVTPTAIGILTNTAVVTSAEDLLTTNNTVTETTVVSFNNAPPTFAPNRSGAAKPGESAIYTHTLSNNSNAAQTFALSAASSAGFNVVITPTNTGPVDPLGGSVVITVAVTVPTNAISGTVDTTVVTATGWVEEVVRDTTTVYINKRFIYLPLILRGS